MCLKKYIEIDARKLSESIGNEKIISKNLLYDYIIKDFENFSSNSFYFTFLKNPIRNDFCISADDADYRTLIEINNEDLSHYNAIYSGCFSDESGRIKLYDTKINKIELSNFDLDRINIDIYITMCFDTKDILDSFRKLNVFPEYYGYLLFMREFDPIKYSSNWRLLDIFQYTKPLMFHYTSEDTVGVIIRILGHKEKVVDLMPA